METLKVYALHGLSRRMQALLREGQQDAARVWNTCKDLHPEARRHGTRWANRDVLQQAPRADLPCCQGKFKNPQNRQRKFPLGDNEKIPRETIPGDG